MKVRIVFIQHGIRGGGKQRRNYSHVRHQTYCLVARDGAVLDGAVVSGVLRALDQERDDLHLLLIVEGHLENEGKGEEREGSAWWTNLIN